MVTAGSFGMADPPSDPALLFSTPPRGPTSSPAEHPPTTPEHIIDMDTTRRASPSSSFCVEIRPLPKDQKALYKPFPQHLVDEGVPVQREWIESIIGEYTQGTTRFYYARFTDGEAHRFTKHAFETHFPDLVQDYEGKKSRNELQPFDPSGAEVHPASRMHISFKISKSSFKARTYVGSTTDSGSGSLSPLTESDTDYDSDASFSGSRVRRKNTRSNAYQGKQTTLPWSPKKRRPGLRKVTRSSSEDELAGYGIDEKPLATRKSGRSRRSARDNLADEYMDDSFLSDSDEEGYGRKGRGKLSRPKRTRHLASPQYGHFRPIEELDWDFDEDEDTAPLRAHRDVCERCEERPAHVLERSLYSKKAKKKAKKSRRGEDGEFEEDEEEKIQRLGGWVQCLKCPVTAHWGCLAKNQRDELLKAARRRDEVEFSKAVQENPDNPPEDTPLRIELDISETTDFICGSCSKGGTCMGCNEVAPKPEMVAMEPAVTAMPENKASEDVPMADGTGASSEPLNGDPPTIQEHQPRELLYRCFLCKRACHYAHLPVPDHLKPNGDDPLDVVAIAVYYQSETGWCCNDCASFVFDVDKILAWRPYPSNSIEPSRPIDDSSSYKNMLPREYLIKWVGRSYKRVQWVPHMWLLAKAPAKLRNFVQHGTKVPLLPEPVSDDRTSEAANEPKTFEVGADNEAPEKISLESFLGPLPDAEKRIPPAWKLVDRVLDVRFWSPERIFLSKGNKKQKRVHAIVSSEEETGEAEAELSPALHWMRESAYNDGEQPEEDVLEDLDEHLERTGQGLDDAQADRVIWAFIKWDDLGYDEASWDTPPRVGEPGYEQFATAFRRFIASRSVIIKSKKADKDYDNRPKDKFRREYALKEGEQPDLGQSSQLKLMPFQIEGYNWLCNNWWELQHCILADEMGLGKTVQIVTFLGTIIGKWHASPALVVVPNSTITNWVREFERWAPRLRVVPFYGEAKSREIVLKYEMFHDTVPKGATKAKYHVLITTYESITNPRDFTTVFKNTPRWECLVVDEGQRLKSDASLLFKKLNDLNTMHRIIMTGTPLNNNIRELFNLMNFLDPKNWNNLKELEEEYADLTEERVRTLHTLLRPYFLRRIKSEVLHLPPKNEVIVPVSMAPLQREIYRSVLSQNLTVLKHLSQTSVGGSSNTRTKTNLNNILMQLRKCLQHPYLVSEDLEPRNLTPIEAHEKLIDASAKLRLLKMLLPKLKARGHRVLLFSQFVMALDIIEDFLQGEGYRFLRLDGNQKQADRQKGMDEFNKPGSDIFIYMLSTRAGGVGINLYTADTVIIFDPDFNPHQDLQAIARSHRFGQQKTCLVFKLMVKQSAEERIMQNGKKKLVLDHLIVQKMDDEENGGDDMQSILTFGAKAILEQESMRDITYTDQDLDKLIEKTEQEGEEQEPAAQNNVAFSFAKVWSAGKDELEDIGDDVPDHKQGDSWAQALERIAAAEKATQKEATGRGVRRRAAAAGQKMQVIEGIDDVEDTPRKGEKTRKKKKHPGKSGNSSDDDDVYVGRDAASSPSSGDETEPYMGDPEELRDLTTNEAGASSKKKKRNRKRSPHSPDSEASICGLCGLSHPDEECSMTGDSENLAKYRALLLENTDYESWEERKAAIELIDLTLRERGHEKLIAGQPLHPVKPKQPAKPAERKTTAAPRALPPSLVKMPAKESVVPNRDKPTTMTMPSGGPAPALAPVPLSMQVPASKVYSRYNWIDAPPTNVTDYYHNQLGPASAGHSFESVYFVPQPAPAVGPVASSSATAGYYSQQGELVQAPAASAGPSASSSAAAGYHRQQGAPAPAVQQLHAQAPQNGQMGGVTSAFRVNEYVRGGGSGSGGGAPAQSVWRAVPQHQGQPFRVATPTTSAGGSGAVHPSVPTGAGAGTSAKRTLSPPALESGISKKAKHDPLPGPSSSSSSSLRRCSVCGGRFHLLKDCPIVTEGPASIVRAINRLGTGPSHTFTVHVLRNLLKQEEQRREAAERSRPA